VLCGTQLLPDPEIGETWRPCLAASATSGPAIDTDRAAGSTVVIARLKDLKITTSSRMTKRTDRL
jgi:hypothetical protein